MNKLRCNMCYLIGPMDRAPDGGKQWREAITPRLEEMGVIVLNPCKKEELTNSGLERIEDRKYRQELKDSGRYDELAEQVRELRRIDLRMVDYSSFLICYVDLDIFMCGTFEELFLGNKLKRPCLILVKQGKKYCPDWLFGVVPHNHIFDYWDELFEYLRNIDNGMECGSSRWIHFNLQEKMRKALDGIS